MKKISFIVIALILFLIICFASYKLFFENKNKDIEKKEVININEEKVDTIKQENSLNEEQFEISEEESNKKDKDVANDTSNNDVKDNSSINVSKNNNSNNNTQTTSKEIKPNNTPESSKLNNNQSNNNETTNSDDKTWEEFKKDSFVLMILESNSIDWENKSEQDKEANKWINLGYRVEMPYQCISLSSGTRCVYGLIVYLPKGVCNETPNEIKIDWRKRNYVGIVTYAKSLGYSCEGYHD